MIGTGGYDHGSDWDWDRPWDSEPDGDEPFEPAAADLEEMAQHWAERWAAKAAVYGDWPVQMLDLWQAEGRSVASFVGSGIRLCPAVGGRSCWVGTN